MTAKPFASVFAASLFLGWAMSASAQTQKEIPAHPRTSGFQEDAILTGTFYYLQRERSRKDMADNGKYKTGHSHATLNASLDFQSGYAADLLGMDIGVFTALNVIEGEGSRHPNEIAFSVSQRAYDENWSGDTNGINLYKAAAKFRYGPGWMRAGYIQPSGQTLLTPSWGLLPGTYQGIETGAVLDLGSAGSLSFSYMWTNKYKAPWYIIMDGFYQHDKITRVDYLHSIGFKHDFKNDLMLEAAYGRAQGYMDQYFAKIRYIFEIAGWPLSTAYHFYGAHDRAQEDKETLPHSNNDLYDGLAWLQGLTFHYKAGPFDFRLESTWVQAQGNQGFFLQRMTPGYASSNGRLDIGWNSSSDFNNHGEKAIFLGVIYDLGHWKFPGWSFGASYAYGWGARPSSFKDFDQNQRLQESAFSLDIIYTVQAGQTKGMQLKLHFTQFNNHSDIPSHSHGYRNIFQDERDIKFTIIAPFTFL